MKCSVRVAETAFRSLPGVIYGPEGTPLSDAIVRLPALNRATRTGKYGEFNFETLPAKTLKELEVEAAGQEMTVELNELASPVAIHFHLQQ